MIKKKVIASLSAVLLFSSPFLGGIAQATGDDSNVVENETPLEVEVIDVENKVQIEVEEVVEPVDDDKGDDLVTEEVQEDEVASLVLANVSFKDVTEKSYAYEAIKYLANKGVIKGYGNGYYGLKDDVTRGQVSALIARYLELDTNKTFDNPYSDVKGDSFEKEILAVTNAGYMQGKGKNKFDPRATLTRAEMAVVLTNVFGLKVKAEHDFHDMNGHWATKEVRALYSNGLTLGAGKGKYEPEGKVTREQYAEFLYRGIHLDEDFVAEPIPKPEPPKPEKPKPEEPMEHRALETGKLYDIDTTSVVQAFWNKHSNEIKPLQAFKNAQNLRNTMSGSLAISNNIKAVKDDKNKRFVITIPKYDTKNYLVSLENEDGYNKNPDIYYAYYDEFEPSTGVCFALDIAELNYGSYVTYNLYGYMKDGKYYIGEGSKARNVIFGRD